MSRLTATQQTELRRLHGEVLAFVRWAEEHQGFAYGAGLIKAADKALAEAKLTPMKALAREVRGFFDALPPAGREALLASMGAAGRKTAARSGGDVHEARRILARGRVASEAEYHELRHYLDRLEADAEAPAAEVRQVQAVLAAFPSSPPEATT